MQVDTRVASLEERAVVAQRTDRRVQVLAVLVGAARVEAAQGTHTQMVGVLTVQASARPDVLEVADARVGELLLVRHETCLVAVIAVETHLARGLSDPRGLVPDSSTDMCVVNQRQSEGLDARGNLRARNSANELALGNRRCGRLGNDNNWLVLLGHTKCGRGRVDRLADIGALAVVGKNHQVVVGRLGGLRGSGRNHV